MYIYASNPHESWAYVYASSSNRGRPDPREEIEYNRSIAYSAAMILHNIIYIIVYGVQDDRNIVSWKQYTYAGMTWKYFAIFQQ